VRVNGIRHLKSLEKTNAIIKNAENARSVGLANDCLLFGPNFQTFKKHLEQYEELRTRWDSIDWVKIYKPTCCICSIVLDRKNYRNYDSMQKSKGFILSKKRYCDMCKKNSLKVRFNNLGQRLKLLYLGAKKRSKVRGVGLDFD
jgi:hypothetical protein